MLPGDLFVPGLAAFLVGHACYIVGFLQPPSPPGVPPFAFSATGLVVAVLVAGAYAAWPATLLFRALRREGRRALVGPVAVYLVAILTMAVLAATRGRRPPWPEPPCSWCPTRCSPSTGSCGRSATAPSPCT